MIVFQPSRLTCWLPLAIIGLVAGVAQAQTRVEIGFAYIDGRGDASGKDDSSAFGNHDWRPVDRGSGVALSFRHDWDRLYTKARFQRMSLANRATYDRWLFTYIHPDGNWPPIPRGTVWHNRYDERYRSYDLQLGWRQPLGEVVALWVELGGSRESWSTSGGTVTMVFDQAWGERPPWVLALTPHSKQHTTWTGGVGGDFSLASSTTLSVAIDYRNRTYFPSPATRFSGLQGASLLEGVIRLRQGFAGPWEGFIEYRPSEQRQYWQAGIGYRF